jgi:hypothetical protein
MTIAQFHKYLKSKKILFYVLPFGVQIDAKHYSYDVFKNFIKCDLDATFVIDYSANKIK